VNLEKDFWIGPFRLRAPQANDIEAVVSDMRKSDLLDIVAVTAASPFQALALNIQNAERCYSVDHEGRCIAIAGRGRSDGRGLADVWMLGTERFGTLLRQGLAKHSNEGRDMLLAGLKGGYCILPAYNSGDVRWLRWLGFRVVATLPDFRSRGYECLIMARGASPTDLG
jgi:hypothetical protein